MGSLTCHAAMEGRYMSLCGIIFNYLDNEDFEDVKESTAADVYYGNQPNFLPQLF